MEKDIKSLIENEKEIIAAENGAILPEVKVDFNENKEVHKQVEDVITVAGGQKAIEDEQFIEEVAQLISKGVLSEKEAIAMSKERLIEQEYFEKWEQILKFAFIKKPTGLRLMQLGVIWGLICYVFTLIAVLPLLILSEIFSTLNSLFNAVFGEIKVKKNKDGTKTEVMGYNIITKFLFGAVAIMVVLLIIFGFVQAFTGWSVFEAIRSTRK